MKFRIFLPFLIGLSIAFLLYFLFQWWGFLVIFPWIGFAISLGNIISRTQKGIKKNIGRKISALLIMPCLLLFVPIVNNENFQLEGVVLIVMAGFFGKGFIHYAIAKIFGPLIWGRGFCGWACWSAAIFEWLPVKNSKKKISDKIKNIRFLVLIISLLLPAFLVFVLNYDVRRDYIYKQEMLWMFVGNGIYFLLGIPLTLITNDTRSFCKIICPVSLVMKLPTQFAAIKIKTQGVNCTSCGACNKYCPMDVDVMKYVKGNQPVTDTECVLCNDCKNVCPQGVLK